MKNKTIYRLSVGDIQQIAKEVYGRELTTDEIEKVIEPIGDRISWYDVIDEAINYSLDLKQLTKWRRMLLIFFTRKVILIGIR